MRTPDVHKFLRGEIMHPDVPYYIYQIVGTSEDSGSGMPHSEFEKCHNLIQWMFPTMSPSKNQPDSPVLTWDNVMFIKIDVAAQDKLYRSAAYMHRFYSGKVGKPLLLSNRNHNHLRVTRIIQSLSLLRGTDAAKAFLAPVNKMNMAAGYPVNVASVEKWVEAKYYGQNMRATVTK